MVKQKEEGGWRGGVQLGWGGGAPMAEGGQLSLAEHVPSVQS